MDLSNDFLEKLNSVTNKRARFVIDTILNKGYCSTQDLKDAGYEHPPRAARDVREFGIPLETFNIKDRNGKHIAAYKFGNWEEANKTNLLAKKTGRIQLTSKLKKELIARYGTKCSLYGEEYPAHLLQPDHRIPYEIAGNPKDMLNTDYFMLLCPSANRDKSWACEHCANWVQKNIEMCKTCYYAYPESYEHIAGKEERKIDLVFRNTDLPLYESITKTAREKNISNQELLKRILRYIENLKNEDSIF